MKKFDLSKIDTKKLLGIGTAIVMGVVTVASALADQKKDQEFEEMKKTLSALSSSKGDS